MSNLTKNTKLNAWLDEMIALTNPANVVLIDGTDEQAEALRAEACASGELFKLNQEKLPGCYLHRTAVNDVARVENRTFICTTKKEDAGPTNNWMSPKECYDKLTPLFRNSYAGKTMYVIPYSMGVVGSPFAKNGIELTDSIYVVLNMDIMTRMGQQALDQLGDSNDFVRGLHSKAKMEEENRYIVQFPFPEGVAAVVHHAQGGAARLVPEAGAEQFPVFVVHVHQAPRRYFSADGAEHAGEHGGIVREVFQLHPRGKPAFAALRGLVDKQVLFGCGARATRRGAAVSPGRFGTGVARMVGTAGRMGIVHEMRERNVGSAA